ASFDRLVGPGDELPRHIDPERQGGLEVDDQLHPCHLLDRQVARLLALTVRFRQISTVARYMSALLCTTAKLGCRCRRWVISNRSIRHRRSRHVRFSPKADK